jgi:hypothetical protein
LFRTVDFDWEVVRFAIQDCVAKSLFSRKMTIKGGVKENNAQKKNVGVH